MKTETDSQWIPVRRSNLKYYTNLNLYYKVKGASAPLLYKSSELPFTPEYLRDNPFSGSLYIHQDDREECLKAVQEGFSRELKHNIRNEGIHKVKEGLVDLVEESLSQPRAGGLEVMTDTVDNLIEGYARQPEVIRNLARISHSDYTTAIHSINVMALTIGYCYFRKMDETRTREWGLAALFHDVGKTEIPPDILNAPRRLTDYEYEVVKTHPEKGAEILQSNNRAVHCAIPGALEHHERLDGSGYPGGSTEVSEIGQLLAIIDSYEAITNDDRMYRRAMNPIQALETLKTEMDTNGRLNRRMFVDFAYSLAYSPKGGVNGNYQKVLSTWNIDTETGP